MDAVGVPGEQAPMARGAASPSPQVPAQGGVGGYFQSRRESVEKLSFETQDPSLARGRISDLPPPIRKLGASPGRVHARLRRGSGKKGKDENKSRA